MLFLGDESQCEWENLKALVQRLCVNTKNGSFVRQQCLTPHCSNLYSEPHHQMLQSIDITTADYYLSLGHCS